MLTKLGISALKIVGQAVLSAAVKKTADHVFDKSQKYIKKKKKKKFIFF